MKTERTTQLLLGVIATGITALAVIEFEKRYHRHWRRKLLTVAELLKQKTGELKETVLDRWEQAGQHFRECAGCDAKQAAAEAVAERNAAEGHPTADAALTS